MDSAVEERWGHVLSVAGEEARERGEATVSSVHVALALSRSDRVLGPVAERAGFSLRRWRDYMNEVLGGNARARREKSGLLGRPAAADRYYRGPLTVAEGVRLLLADAEHEAARAGRTASEVEALVACLLGAGDVGGGALRWLGVPLARLRSAAGLSHVRRVLPAEPHADPRPAGNGGLLLLGGQDVPPAVVGILPTSTVTTIFAADPTVETKACTTRHWADLGITLTDSHCDSRGDAERPEVVAAIESADAVLLNGGGWLRPIERLAGTAALGALRKVSDRGGMVIGYSAGTQALGTWMMSDQLTGDEQDVVPGLNWLADTIVIAHYPGYDGERRLETTMAATGCTRALGVAHEGALLVSGGGWDSVTPIGASPWPHRVIGFQELGTEHPTDQAG